MHFVFFVELEFQYFSQVINLFRGRLKFIAILLIPLNCNLSDDVCGQIVQFNSASDTMLLVLKRSYQLFRQDIVIALIIHNKPLMCELDTQIQVKTTVIVFHTILLHWDNETLFYYLHPLTMIVSNFLPLMKLSI